MSGLAKVFIVVNFVLSIVFLSGAGMLLAKTDHWKDQYEGEVSAHNKTKSELNERIGQLTARRDELEDSYSKVTNDLGNERNAKDSVTDELARSREENQRLNQSVAKLGENLTNLERNLTSSQDRIQTLEQELDQSSARADVAARKQAEAEDNLTRTLAELSDANDNIEGLQANVEEMRKKNEDLELLRDWVTSKGLDPNEIEAVPAINGVVRGVNAEAGVFILSVGSDDGVKRGQKFYVYRGNEYLGEVYVDQVQADLCSAVAREPMVGVVRQMDQVTTRL